ncbi:MAG: hypothetical protein IKC47_03515 [Clostridia bacterium]|nr:hypothetical protein [Clostridia bacterium]
MKKDALEKYVEAVCKQAQYVFQNEEQFRYALVEMLKHGCNTPHKLQAYDNVYVEVPFENPGVTSKGKYVYVDIVVEVEENKYTLIELKYGTKGKVKNDLKGVNKLENIPNNVISKRIEGYKKDKIKLKDLLDANNRVNEPKRFNGFAILLVNDDMVKSNEVEIHKTTFYFVVEKI